MSLQNSFKRNKRGYDVRCRFQRNLTDIYNENIDFVTCAYVSFIKMICPQFRAGHQ